MYSILDGRDFVLPQENRDVQLGNYGLMMLTETRIHEEVYFRNCLGYNFVCSQVAGIIVGVEQGGWDW